MKVLMLLGSFWGFAEATLFFILPDVGLTRTALFSFHRACWQAAAALLGAVIGGLVLWQWAQRSPEQAQTWISRVPFVRPWMLNQAKGELAQEGASALMQGPKRGIPYKAYAVEAPAFLSLKEFFLISFPARAWRFCMMIITFGAVGFWLRRWPTFATWIPWAHAVLWISFYVGYWIWVAHHS